MYHLCYLLFVILRNTTATLIYSHYLVRPPGSGHQPWQAGAADKPSDAGQCLLQYHTLTWVRWYQVYRWQQQRHLELVFVLIYSST